MRIPRFEKLQHRCIKFLACEAVPQIMIVTGPNGCGKSTLLDSLRNESGGTGPILYVGPHRISGRQRVRMRFLAGQKLLMRDLQSIGDLPNYEGINIHSRKRSAWDFDETSSYLKYALCQIELDRQAALTNRYDKLGKLDEGVLPDIWTPLRDMTENLLPHLHFEKIDLSNRDQIKCLWNIDKHKKIQVDIDDLSSGEKAIIQLFFPLIENQVQALLKQYQEEIMEEKDEQSSDEICVLLDEPELHVHPNLQGKILSYIRNLATRDGIQFILATHSTTIVEQASSQELFLLRPADLIDTGENQLIRVASDDEKLELMREIFGATSNITAMRKILVVEGSKAQRGSKKATDEMMFGFLSDRFSQLTILPRSGKHECKIVAESLSEILSDELSGNLRAYALVDRDLDEEEDASSLVKFLPVSMIENFLIDKEVIWEAIRTVRHKTVLAGISDVEKAIDDILDGMEGYEIDRRIKAGVVFHSFRLHDPIDTAENQAESHIQTVKCAVSEENIKSLTQAAKIASKKIKKQLRRREQFDGKEFLDRFFREYMHRSGMSKEIFVHLCAGAASKRKSVVAFLDKFFREIEVSLYT